MICGMHSDVSGYLFPPAVRVEVTSDLGLLGARNLCVSEGRRIPEGRTPESVKPGPGGALSSKCTSEQSAGVGPSDSTGEALLGRFLWESRAGTDTVVCLSKTFSQHILLKFDSLFTMGFCWRE